MHIAFLLTQDLTSPSGLGRYWPLSKELVRLGHQVTVLALHADYAALRADERRFERDGVRVRYVAQMHVHKTGNTKIYFGPVRTLWIAAVGALKLSLAAAQTPADVYHLGKPHPMNGMAALWPLWAQRKSVYLDCDDYEAGSNRFAKSWQKRIVVFFEDQLPRIAAGITVNTHFMMAHLQQKGYPADKIVYVPNGVDRARFAGFDAQAIQTLRQRLRLVDKKVILYLGSMSLSNHAVDLLLDAFAQVRSTEPQAVLLLVGGGEDYAVLQAQATRLALGESVRFVGRVTPGEAPLYYRLAHISVDPVRDDPAAHARFPLKIVESLVCGVPVVTGDVGERGPLLRNSGLGRLAVPGDSPSLATHILALLQDSAVHADKSQEILPHTETLYWDHLIHNFVSVYRE